MIARNVAPSLDIDRKVTYEDDLELVILRWRYLLRSPNPEPERMAQFSDIVKSQVNRTWVKFGKVFWCLGYGREDLVTLAQVYLVEYLGECGIAEHPQRLQDFAAKFLAEKGYDPDSEEVLSRDRNFFYDFLEQRLTEAAIIASRKNRNVTGLSGNRFAAAGAKSVAATDRELSSNLEGYGYRKITMAEWERLAKAVGKTEKELKRGLEKDAPLEFRAPDGRVIRLIHTTPGSPLTAEDVDGFGMWERPDENREEFEAAAEGFFADEPEALRKIETFVRKNKKNAKLSKELRVAREILNSNRSISSLREVIFPTQSG